MTRATLISTFVIGLAGCGNYFPPSPTARPVTPVDIIGTYTYPSMCSASSAQVTLVLNANNTFDQTVSLPGQNLTQSGAWVLNGDQIELRDALVDFGGWHADGQTWPIVDRGDSPSGFSIFGGAVDPDCWVVFTRHP